MNPTIAATAPEPGGGPRTRRSRAITVGTVARKLGGALAMLIFVALTNFFLFSILPGDPAKTFAPRNRNSDPAALAALRAKYGSGQPIFVQFWKYVQRLAHGDLGQSFGLHDSVGKLILERLWPTVLLSGTALIVSSIIGLWLGARSGWKHGSRFDRVASSAAVTAYSVPEWWLGLLLSVLLASSTGLGIFPTGGMHDPRTTLPGFIDVAWHLVLPATALAVVYVAEYSLIMRSSILDERFADYLTTARAKGLRDDDVLRKHALPNALLPYITLFLLSLGFVVSGAITVETIFSWPGLGLLTSQALHGPDYPLLQGIFLVFSAGVILMNVLADLLYPLFDPRVRRA